jgi:hypothetical protein
VSAAIGYIVAALNLGTGFDPAQSEPIFAAGRADHAEVPLVREGLAAVFSPAFPSGAGGGSGERRDERRCDARFWRGEERGEEKCPPIWHGPKLGGTDEERQRRTGGDTGRGPRP